MATRELHIKLGFGKKTTSMDKPRKYPFSTAALLNRTVSTGLIEMLCICSYVWELNS